MATVNSPKEVEIFRGREVTITGDARAFPLMIVDTNGELDIETFDAYFTWRNAWIAYAEAKGTKLVQISVTNNAKPPSATVRKHIADMGKNDDKLAGLAATYVVVPNALLRGVVTAVTWVMGSSNTIKNYATLGEAAEAAKRYFASTGTRAPEFDPQTYQFPT